jgi:hypothetical protein
VCRFPRENREKDPEFWRVFREIDFYAPKLRSIGTRASPQPVAAVDVVEIKSRILGPNIATAYFAILRGHAKTPRKRGVDFASRREASCNITRAASASSPRGEKRERP